jgi:hypothetical protein
MIGRQKNFKEFGRKLSTYISVLSRNFLGGTKEYQENLSEDR